VTAGALNEVVKRFRMLLGTEGGCVPAGAPALKSVEIRVWGFREEEMFYLGDCIESPIYRGGELPLRRCHHTSEAAPEMELDYKVLMLCKAGGTC